MNKYMVICIYNVYVFDHHSNEHMIFSPSESPQDTLVDDQGIGVCEAICSGDFFPKGDGPYFHLFSGKFGK